MREGTVEKRHVEEFWENVEYCLQKREINSRKQVENATITAVVGVEIMILAEGWYKIKIQEKEKY